MGFYGIQHAAGEELSAALYGRVDMAKYSVGLATDGHRALVRTPRRGLEPSGDGVRVGGEGFFKTGAVGVFSV